MTTAHQDADPRRPVPGAAAGSRGFVHSAAEQWFSLAALVLLLVLLASVYPAVRASSYRGGPEFHATIEIVGAIIGLLAGAGFLARFCGLEQRSELLLGLAFLVNGVEDLVHGFMDLAIDHDWLTSPLLSFREATPATYVIGRVLMALLLLLAALSPRWLGRPRNPKRETAWFSISVLVITLLCTAAAFQVPLPAFFLPQVPARHIARPLDLVSAILFAAALVAFLRQYHRTRARMSWWLALSTGINVVGQVMMSFSREFYDPCFEIAHVYKVLGYAAPLLGFALYQASTILELKQADAVLRQSEERLRLLVESVADYAILMLDGEGRVASWNVGAERIQGYRAEEIIGQPFSRFYPPEEIAAGKPAAELRIAAEQGHFEDEGWHVRKDGSRFWASVATAAVRDDMGDLRGFARVTRDVTERKRAERELQLAHQQLLDIVEFLPDATFVIDQDKRVIAWNRALEAMTGVSKDAIIGKGDYAYAVPFYGTRRPILVDLIGAENPEAVAGYDYVDHRGNVLCAEVFLPSLYGGRGAQIWIIASPLLDKLGNRYGAIESIRDITERKQAEEELARHREHLEELVTARTAELARANVQLERARDAAEAASRAKSTFLANMSHEIRTPLNAIIGMTELVLKGQLSGQQREFLTTVMDSGEALLSVINDILDFSRIEAGKLALDCETFDLRESLGDTMKSFAIRAHQQGLELACYIHPEVPHMVVGDYNRLRQVMVNLVGNAIKFTEKGEVTVELTQESRAEKEVILHFTVSDTGTGIPEEKRGVIFEMFEQADNSMRRRHGGTGLGLAIATRIVSLMDGRIWVESEVGRGSRFHFTARLGLADAEPRATVPAEPACLHGLRALVVDDNATNRRILEEVLRSWNMAPMSAPNAREALRLLRQAHAAGEPFRLVLTDSHMPEVDGFQLAEQIKQSQGTGSTVVMMLTSGDRPEDTARCDQLGIAAYLLKPIKQSELLEAIAHALGISVLGEELSGAAAEPAPQLRSLHILLAEDSLVNQKLAVALLESRGHSVVVANNGQEAVSAIESRKFDLVLMDVQMPEMDGLEATAAIRAREKQTGARLPIIAMTAHALKGDRERCLEAGMDGYIAKPIRSAELFRAIEGMLSDSPQQDASACLDMREEDLVNWSDALRTVEGNRQLLRTVVEAAVQEIPQLMVAIRRAIGAAEASKLRLAAHTLKGSLRYFGAAGACKHAERLEEMAKAHSVQGAESLLENLEGEIAQILKILGDYLERTPKSGGSEPPANAPGQ